MDAIMQFWRDPAMPYAESRRACHSHACYKPHTHPTYSIGAIDSGGSRFTGAGDSPVTLHPGTVIVIPAARVHACNPLPGSTWSYQMLHLDVAWLRTVRQEYALADAEGEDAEPVRILRQPAAYAGFCELNALLFSDADPQDKEAALIEFIGDADAAQGLVIDAAPQSPSLADRILPALELLRKAPADNTPLEYLARLANMSRYQLIRAFRAVTGLTPHSWQLNQRVNLARERIRAGESLVEVAYALGFADQAHFHRVFKAYAGVTPGGFRD